jgi:4-hydroxythreonine-4-phosphate dehydrogenase
MIMTPLSRTSSLPVVALTPGDPSGIGPEIILRSLAEPSLKKLCRFVLIGNRRVFERTLDTLSKKDKHNAETALRDLEIKNVKGPFLKSVCSGKISATAGRFSYNCVVAGVKAVLSGEADTLVTAPISKIAWHSAGITYAGHTEALAALTRTQDVAMSFFVGRLRVATVTTHLPLNAVPQAINCKAVLQTLRVLDHWLRSGEGRQSPRIAVTGLNPHAGEDGRLGKEEARAIVPAIRDAIREGINAEGPFPADSLFARKPKGWDGIVAMYHDQGLIAAKLLGNGSAINVTLGLPFIRTSPDHGTAFSIAGQGRADVSSQIAAIQLAAQMTKRKKQ